MNKISFFGKQLCFCLLAALLISCRGKDNNAVSYKPFPVKLVYGEAVEPWALALQNEVNQSQIILPNQTQVSIELIKETALVAADKIARGEIKTHLWLAPSTVVREFVNRRLVNLGAAQSECIATFSSPVVLAALEENALALEAKSRMVDLKKLFLRNDFDEPNIVFSQANPLKSESGLYSALQLYQTLIDKQASSSVASEVLRKSQEYVSNYSDDENYLLDRAIEAGTSKVSTVLLTEQQIIQYNKKVSSKLLPFYFKDDSVVKDYQICVSQADWVTTAHKAAIEQIKKIALSPNVQKAALNLGYRPESISAEELQAYRAKLDLPNKKIMNSEAEVVSDILLNWENYAKPLALTIVLDSSLAFSADIFSRIQNALHHYLSNKQKSTMVTLVTFASATKEYASFEKDSSKLASTVTLILPSAGTLLYDGLRQGFELAVSPQTEGYRRRLVFISSSEDKGSVASFEGLSSFAVTRLAKADIDIIALLDNSSSANDKELKLLLSQMGASVETITLDNVYELLKGVF